MRHCPPKVFVVDDDRSVRRALGRLLRAAGYETELFDAAEAYLAREAPQPPACLVLDVRMPHMTGLELQRAMEGTPMELPIVFITGHADEEFAEALAAVAVRVLYKPLDDIELLAAIELALARSLGN
jgi:FixJ family two-component response regulator